MPEIKVLNNRELLPFIQGETIDLCIPNADEDVIGNGLIGLMIQRQLAILIMAYFLIRLMTKGHI